MIAQLRIAGIIVTPSGRDVEDGRGVEDPIVVEAVEAADAVVTEAVLRDIGIVTAPDVILLARLEMAALLLRTLV